MRHTWTPSKTSLHMMLTGDVSQLRHLLRIAFKCCWHLACMPNWMPEWSGVVCGHPPWSW